MISYFPHALLALPTSKTIHGFCSTCGTFQTNGKASCCAVGGSWFKKCGAGFDHTWLDGIRACSGFETAANAAFARAQYVILQNVTQSLNTRQAVTGSRHVTTSQEVTTGGPQEVNRSHNEVNNARNITQAQTINCDTVSNDGTADYTRRIELTSLSFIVLILYM